MSRIDPKLDAIEKTIKAEGVTQYVLIVSDPDSDEYGGRSGDTVWAVGATTLYLKYLKNKPQEDVA